MACNNNNCDSNNNVITASTTVRGNLITVVIDNKKPDPAPTPAPTPAPAPLPPVRVRIPRETEFKGKDASLFKVMNEFLIDLPVGTRVMMDDCRFVLVHAFADSAEKLPINPQKGKILIPNGTMIEKADGIPFFLAADISVECPVKLEIVISTGLKLQSTGGKIKMSLLEECKATPIY